ncbi:hypothetical protein OXPF_01530 [Oxobacter pfennigii]|uniref:Uncharacterized protein n=1 Tax=Oxobacter pfennigii TaxID=36849 RepID=A0A0P8WU59_9CLOT|nr:hypothetical protein [Oxobacter pfennigii]KPU46234.1 hypothetical protein OXPF_01530 [Oxobacter pfennigii]
MRGKKIISYLLVLIIGVSIGLAVGLFFNRNQQDDSLYNSMNNELKNAMPDTMGNESVNNEIITLLTDMHKNNDYLYLHKAFFTNENNTSTFIYPSKTVDDDMFGRITSLFNEYEWRANRTLSSFNASDFDMFIEIYSTDKAQVLTLYRGYNILCYKDEDNEITAYYSYVFSEGDNNADLAVRLLNDFIDK